MLRVRYDDLVLGKVYIIKTKDRVYTGKYYMHYRQCFDENDPLTFIEVTPNPTNKKYFEFMPSDEYYEVALKDQTLQPKGGAEP
jgi:hypothetical protein